MTGWCQFAEDERQICQMQYMSWPDHGVPDDCTEFLTFVNEVRQCRAGVVESAIIHCRSETPSLEWMIIVTWYHTAIQYTPTDSVHWCSMSIVQPSREWFLSGSSNGFRYTRWPYNYYYMLTSRFSLQHGVGVSYLCSVVTVALSYVAAVWLKTYRSWIHSTTTTSIVLKCNVVELVQGIDRWMDCSIA